MAERPLLLRLPQQLAAARSRADKSAPYSYWEGACRFTVGARFIAPVGFTARGAKGRIIRRDGLALPSYVIAPCAIGRINIRPYSYWEDDCRLIVGGG